MSYTYRQTISTDLAALIDAKRGPASVQDFTTAALIAACGVSPVVLELRQEIERLHATIRALSGAHSAEPVKEFELTFD